MRRDLIERLRAANPVPRCATPSIDDLWRTLDRGAGGNEALVPGRRARARGWLGRSLVAAPTLIAVAVTIAVVAIALTALGHGRHAPAHPGPVGSGHLPFSPMLFRAARQATRTDPACRPPRTTPAPAVSYGAPNRAVLSFLGVLRQPRTAADRLASQLYPPGPKPAFVNYIRRARTAHGTTYYVIPAGTSGLGGTPLSTRCIGDITAAARHVLPDIPAAQRTATVHFLETFQARQERLSKQPSDGAICLLAMAGRTQGTECVRGSEVQRHGMFAFERRPVRGALVGGGAYLAGLVPDGVATVTIRFEGPALAPPATVIHNLFVVHVPRADVGPTAMIWRSAGGARIRTILEPASGGGPSEGFGQSPRP
jgi:hypothetical protein